MVSINGFYSAFMSGEDGQGYALLVFKDGNIVGADPLGVQFDGVYSKDGQGWSGEVTVKAPPGAYPRSYYGAVWNSLLCSNSASIWLPRTALHPYRDSIGACECKAHLDPWY